MRVGGARAAFAAALILVGAAAAFAADIVIPSLTGRVVDQAGILSSSEESSLSSKLAALENKTTIQLVVVTLKSLQNRTIEEWGLALGRGWGIGQVGKNNGVLLIVAPSERELRIEVGYGLEGTLPDATANSIIRNVIVPQFKAGNMVSGINDGVDAIGRVLAGEVLVGRAISNQDPRFAWVPFALAFGFIFIVAIISILRNARRVRDGLSDGSDSVWTWSAGGLDSDSNSSSSGWSSGGSGGGGGGFSGGGGSFGGGGSSGKW